MLTLSSSCGSFTYGHYTKSDITGHAGCHDVTTVGNYCQPDIWKQVDGNAGGVSIFVATDCTTGTPLGFCKQNPIYLRAGVSRNQTVNQNWIDAHFNSDLNQPVLGTAKAACEQNNWPPPGQ